MNLAIFDLDNTLLNGDSDYLWGQFLADKGVVDRDYYETKNLKFYEEYKAGTLDIQAFLAFSLQPLADNPVEQLKEWRREYLTAQIHPIVAPGSRSLLEKHRQRGDFLLIITATNRFVTEPIAEWLGVDHLLATDPELIDGRYTGRVAGIPCFQDGKVTRLKNWLKTNGYDLDNSTFYSDSHNDLPLLKVVTHPVAVDPDEPLSRYARSQGWPIISLREGEDAVTER